MTEEQVFLAALDLPDATQRSAYLDTACGGDITLRQQVEELLAVHFKSGEFLHAPLAPQLGAPSAAPTIAETLYISGDPANDSGTKGKMPDDEAEELYFLEPSHRADSLGRIGHYEVLQVLGKGGFGIVFRAFDDVLQRVVALKVLASTIAATSPARKRFLREAQASARVRHENVVQVHAVEELPIPYLVMEFIAGETLQQRLDRKGPLEVAEIVSLGRQVAEGLAAAHATGLIHRDIKPGNILIEGGSTDRVKITDFGLARAADDASLTQSGMVAGTPMFMAPEQAQGEALDQRADLFSLGSVLYVMASGRPPFRAGTTFAVLKRVVEEDPRPIADLIPETPPWLCDIIAKLHAKDPDQRYQSAREVADVLANCEAQLNEHSRLKDLSLIPRAMGQTVGQWKWVAAAAVLLPLIALAATEVLGVTRLFSSPEQQSTPDVVKNDEQSNPSDAVATAVAKRHFASDEWIDVIPLIDPQLDKWDNSVTGRNEWRVERGELVAASADAKPSKLLLPLDAAWRSYECEIEFTRRSGPGGFNVNLPSSVGDCPTVFNPPNKAGVFLGSRDGGVLLNDETQIESGKRSTVRLVVRKEQQNDQVFAWFNDAAAGGWKGDLTSIAVRAKVGYPMARRLSLWIHGGGNEIVFHRIRVRTLDGGTAEKLRSATSSTVDSGWVKLFNGQNLAGWKAAPEAPGNWKVKDGLLVGSQRRSNLFTVRDDYANFHLRVEAKVNLGGDSGVFFRFGSWPHLDGGNEAELHKNRSYARKTGTITRVRADAAPVILGLTTDDSLTRPDEWFTLEIIAEGDRFITKVNGLETANCTDSNNPRLRGHLGLQVWNANTRVEFRKIEIKELPASDASPALATVPFDAAQAKAHQQAWAKHLGADVEITNSIDMKLRLIPPGEFRMGTTPAERERVIELANTHGVTGHELERIASEGVPHPVRLTKPYRIGSHEVTRGQFQKFIAATGHKTTLEQNGLGGWSHHEGKWVRRPEHTWSTPGQWEARDDEPAVHVTSQDARAFCKWLSHVERREYVLPTEAEWEFACRAGSTAPYGTEDHASLGEYAWISKQAGMPDPTHPMQVGLKKPNAFGLHDMLGNVWECCSDRYAAGVDRPDLRIDPTGPESGPEQVIRGGAWYRPGAVFARGSCRQGHRINESDAGVGFRVALVWKPR